VRGLFAGTAIDLEFFRGHNPWRFDSAEHYVHFMETNYGPTLKARERLTAEGRWEACRRRSTRWRASQRGDGRQPADACGVPRDRGSQGRLDRVALMRALKTAAAAFSVAAALAAAAVYRPPPRL
jgi:hypothetical protein